MFRDGTLIFEIYQGELPSGSLECEDRMTVMMTHITHVERSHKTSGYCTLGVISVVIKLMWTNL